jgi:PhoH-like ATPase
MSNHYTGVVVAENLDNEIIQAIYKDKKVLAEKVEITAGRFYQNQYVVLKDYEGRSAITRKKGDILCLLDKRLEKMSVSGIVPRNKEQVMYLDSLLDPSITCVAATGRAGSGKSLLSLAK